MLLHGPIGAFDALPSNIQRGGTTVASGYSGTLKSGFHFRCKEVSFIEDVPTLDLTCNSEGIDL